jgi:uncharacterized membrane protein
MEDLVLNGQDPLWNILARFGVAIVVLFIVIRLIYYRYSRDKGNAFSFFQMGIMIFLVCILLKTVEIKLGVALGLFAIFALLRFRSRNILLRDLTYLFTVLGISVINSMATFYNPLRGSVIINALIIASLIVLEYFFHKKADKLSNCRLVYDKLELLDPARKKELLSDLITRAGFPIEKARIRKIDLIEGRAELVVYFKNGKKPGDPDS